MVTDNDDILSDSDGDEAASNGDFAVGDGTLDDCFIIFGLNTTSQNSPPDWVSRFASAPLLTKKFVNITPTEPAPAS